MIQSHKRALWHARIKTMFREFIAFGLVGAVGFIVDFGVSNLLWATLLPISPDNQNALWGKAISTVLAIIVNWIGNRFWTFRNRRSNNVTREGVEFFLVSLVGMLIPLACIWFTQDVLGQHSTLAINIAGNFVGLGLGALFRFTMYRLWVYSPYRKHHKLAAARKAAEEKLAARKAAEAAELAASGQQDLPGDGGPATGSQPSGSSAIA